MPDITICMLTHNRSWHFAQCLASLKQFTRMPYKMLVLDTNSEQEHRLHMDRISSGVKWEWADTFYSCLGGRRKLLEMCDTEFMVYLDDDIRVGPQWLGNMWRQMQDRADCAAVTCNIVQEEKKIMSGTRYLVKYGSSYVVEQHEVNHIGRASMCMGGATLYRRDALEKTEYRQEFAGGYEDWDQTLQLTQDLGYTIYGSNGCVFHKHMMECAGYFQDRWRWHELMDSAIGMWDRWQVRTAIEKVLGQMVQRGIVLTERQADKVKEVLT